TRSYGDWSSDVCSSDLEVRLRQGGRVVDAVADHGDSGAVHRHADDLAGLDVELLALSLEVADDVGLSRRADIRMNLLDADLLSEIGRASCRERDAVRVS